MFYAVASASLQTIDSNNVKKSQLLRERVTHLFVIKMHSLPWNTGIYRRSIRVLEPVPRMPRQRCRLLTDTLTLTKPWQSAFFALETALIACRVHTPASPSQAVVG